MTDVTHEMGRLFDIVAQQEKDIQERDAEIKRLRGIIGNIYAWTHDQSVRQYIDAKTDEMMGGDE